MLCGPHPNSTATRPLIVARWYRVLSIEGRDHKLDAYGRQVNDATQPDRRLVSLRGPEWPWQPASDLTNYSLLSNTLYVCIPTNAVAVHSKTVHLESGTTFSGGAGGGSEQRRKSDGSSAPLEVACLGQVTTEEQGLRYELRSCERGAIAKI